MENLNIDLLREIAISIEDDNDLIKFITLSKRFFRLNDEYLIWKYRYPIIQQYRDNLIYYLYKINLPIYIYIYKCLKGVIITINTLHNFKKIDDVLCDDSVF